MTESWQGGELDVIFVDFVRAKNLDAGNLGFLTKKERLNVLLSRQEQFLFVIGDMECCDHATITIDPATTAEPAVTAEPDEDEVEGDKKSWGRNDLKNVWVTRVLTWFKENGRVIDFTTENLRPDIITLEVEEKEEDQEVVVPGWGNEETEHEEAGTSGLGGNETELENTGTDGRETEIQPVAPGMDGWEAEDAKQEGKETGEPVKWTFNQAPAAGSGNW